jgi:hypothetical protein
MYYNRAYSPCKDNCYPPAKYNIKHTTYSRNSMKILIIAENHLSRKPLKDIISDQIIPILPASGFEQNKEPVC